MDRFAMAQAPLKRAWANVDWIGDDHGDRYEATMIASVVDEEMQSVMKEILEQQSELARCR
ncbi:hypothetical protein ACFHWW_26515 [Ensifer sp. P24N7]|uniref:hypothetical protein n=1 Tax=Sinorhizobium sp. P24N7 TaxID=3348358 RepID=UPI0035F43AE2